VIAQLSELYAYQRILMLLLERRVNGRGCHVAIDVHGAFAAHLDARIQ
jgi:crotonobetainyl-CoA:carnitine CoA-transferase CaiB-like acyl-CoA transferase